MLLSVFKKYLVIILGLTVSLLIAACGEVAQPVPTMTPQPTATPLPEIELNMELPDGDPEKGYLTAIRYRCNGCHVEDDHLENGPRFAASDELPNILERGEVRIADPEYQGRATSNYEYIIESILLPEAYFVEGEWPEAMSIYNINIIKDQELADILAWMETLE